MVKKLAAVLVVAVLVVGLGIEIWRTTHEGGPTGPLQTVLRGINAQGDMTGYTSHTVLYDGGESWLLTATQGHGFLLRHGTYISIDGPPGATAVYPAHVNPEGDVVGTYDGSDGHQHGFLWRHGTATPIDYPGAAFTVAQGINAAIDLRALGMPMDPMDGTTLAQEVGSVVAGDVSPQGDIVGTYRLPDPRKPSRANTKTPNLIYHGFLWHNGRFTTIDAH